MTEQKQPIFFWTVYRRLLTYTMRYYWILLVGVFGFIVYAQTQWIWAELIKYILHAIEQEDQSKKNLIPVAISVIFLVRGIGSFLGNYGVSYVARKVIHELRIQVFQHLLHLENAYLSQQTVGSLLAKLTYNIEQVAGACSNALKVLLQEGFIVICLMSYLLWSNWQLAMLFFLITPLIGLVVNYASKRLRMLSFRIQESMGDVTHIANEVIQGYTTVKSYGGEKFEFQRFNQSSLNNLRQSLKLVVTQSVNTPVVQLIVAFALSILVWLALQSDIFGEITSGEFIAFITAAGLLVKPIRQLTQINNTIQQGIAGAQSIFELLDMPFEQDAGTREFATLQHALTFKKVNFAYAGSNAQVLKDLNFVVRKGDTIAVVGRSGEGKSTLVHLLMRFYKPQTGAILIDEVPIDHFTLKSWRRNIAYVSQKITIFNDTIAHNIAYGELEQHSAQDIAAAAKSAHAMEFIERLPQKMDTIVGEDGIQLSGGQRQRIAIARALLKNAPILILDEATSALDNESEHYIQAALESVMAGRTTIIIAHRLSTIESADQIIVLHKGQIQETGTHQQLITQQGIYAKLQGGFIK